MSKRLLRPLLLFAVSYSQAAFGDNIVQSMAGASEFMLGLFYIVGIALIFSGINKLKKLGHRTAFMNVDSGITGPMAMILIGSCLIFVPSFLEVLNKSIWGSAGIAAADE